MACSPEKDRDFDAYAAGLIDGEGSITISTRTDKTWAGFVATVGVEMSTKAIPVINALHWHYGGSVNLNRQKAVNHASTVRWAISGQAAACVLWRLAPQLVLKRPQALTVIEAFALFPAPPTKNRAWTPDRVAHWKIAREAVMRGNARGADLPVEGSIAQRVGNRWVSRKVDLFGERWETFSGPWPISGSMRNGIVSAQARSGHPTAESGSSSWPTPDANAINDGESLESWQARKQRNLAKRTNGNGMGTPLAIAAKQWPTPNVPNGGRAMSPEDVEAKGSTARGKPQVDLGSVASLWPTPHGFQAGNGPDGNEFSNAIRQWPTPRTSDTNGPGSHGDGAKDLRTTASQWGTPRVTTNSGHGAIRTDDKSRLEDQAAMWATPTVPNGGRHPAPGQSPTGMLPDGRKRQVDLSHQAREMPTPGDKSSPSARTSRPQLNPAFVGWLMGWPEGWEEPLSPLDLTAYASWAMASSLLLRRLLSSRSRRGPA